MKPKRRVKPVRRKEIAVMCGVPVDPAKRYGIPYSSQFPDVPPLPCHKCGERLCVGPRITAAVALGVKLWCPSCMLDTFGVEAVADATRIQLPPAGPDS